MKGGLEGRSEPHAMESIADLRVSPEQYLTLDDQAELKSEFADGLVFAISPASPVHDLLVSNVGAQLRSGLRGGPCRAYGSGLRVTTPSRHSYSYPDLSVICGHPELADGRKDVVTNPTVIVEVLSESSAARDRGHKFLAYQMIPSLLEYLLVSPEEPRLECYRRRGDTSWVYTRVEGLGSSLRLRSVDVKLTLQEVYLDIFPDGPQ
jgi:Uma2 family endonuclease